MNIGRYAVLGTLGTGSSSVVYRARDTTGGGMVALKIPRPELPTRERRDAAALLAAEAAQLARLDHPGIVALLHYDADAAPPFLVLEFVDGESLAERLERHIAFDPSAAVVVVAQILAALEHAHARGIRHRDLKPANVMLTRSGDVKLLDFGIGAGAGEAVLGTAGYVPPESYAGASPDVRADVYAVGALLYQMLTGRTPFTGSAGEILQQALTQHPLAPSLMVQRHSLRRFDAAILTALARDPDARHASAVDFRAALERASADG